MMDDEFYTTLQRMSHDYNEGLGHGRAQGFVVGLIFTVTILFITVFTSVV